MLRRYAAGLIALALLLGISITLKYFNNLAATEPDIQRMRADVASALEKGGYTATLPSGSPKWWYDGLVTAQIGNCEVFLRDATYFGPEHKAISARRMNGGRPLRYIWGEEYVPTYPRIQIEAQWRIQRELARLGWRYGIYPIIAVGAPDGCWPNPEIFQSVRIFYKPNG